MSLALEFLDDYLKRTKTTQADFARAAGFDASLFTKLAQKEVSLSSKNVPKILRAISNDADRMRFLSKYLEDQIPGDFKESITVHFTGQAAGLVMEAEAEEEPLDIQVTHAFNALPSDLYRRRLIRFLNHLKKDSGLRDLFTRTVAYLEESDTK